MDLNTQFEPNYNDMDIIIVTLHWLWIYGKKSDLFRLFYLYTLLCLHMVGVKAGVGGCS